jgi:ABC-type multidrug transport system ATPase subunit
LLATHDADEALELCDRLAVLDRGRVVAQGTVRALAAMTAQHRHRIVVPARDVPAARTILASSSVIAVEQAAICELGWATLDCDVPGGAAEGAAVLRRLAAGGVSVAEFA